MRTFTVFRILLLLGVISGSAGAQTASTQILGLITDSTGAVVPNATVTARRVEAGDVRTTRSNEPVTTFSRWLTRALTR
jgi:hypothetical protein